MSGSQGADSALVAAVDDLFSGVAAAPGAADRDRFDPAVWHRVHGLGLTLVGVPDASGGSGGSLHDALAVIESGARHAVPLPLAESFLAATRLAAAGEPVPDGPLTVPMPCPGDQVVLSEGQVRGRLREVPWVRDATVLVARTAGTDSAQVVAVPPADLRLRGGESLAGEPVAEVEFGVSADVARPAAGTAGDDFWLGALCRTAQIAGALQAVSRITQRYVQERSQFGKPIGRFQAVQQHVVTVAQAAETATMALWSAAREFALAGGPPPFEACVAKLVADECARVGARAAHQAHGAIGMTREYPLHLFTRRLHVWRHQFGTERQLSLELGGAVRSAPSLARVVSDQGGRIGVACPM